MRAVICTFAMAVSAVAPRAYADVPPGPDAINGAFVRLLAPEAATATTTDALPDPDRAFEHWVNRVARNEMSSAEAGFAHMLARADEVPRPSLVSGEPDPVAVMIARALAAQQLDAQVLARRD